MNSHLLRGNSDAQLIRDFVARLPRRSTVADLDEALQIASIRATTRLWQHNQDVIAFAFVDDYNNLRFEVYPAHRSGQIAEEIVAWGVSCIRQRNRETGQDRTLDASCWTDDAWQIAMLEQAGFVRDDFRTLRYARSLSKPIAAYPMPPGFALRCVEGDHEVEQLVGLHRAAFGTTHMTVEQRLAIMHAPGYQRELDLVAVAPDGELAAFCICGYDNARDPFTTGFTDPIGVHPRFQRLGLGKAVVTDGLRLLASRGGNAVELGTGSDNMPMQRLAESLGFVCVLEKLWFSKTVA